MAITDELREWCKDRFFMANGWQEIHAIADRIASQKTLFDFLRVDNCEVSQ